MAALDEILQFINRYYLDPIFQDSGYNPVNTITWALILGICVFGVVRLMKKLDVEVDDHFIFSVIPFVLAGSSLRVLEDAGVFTAPLSYLFITPNIYFMVFAVTLLCLVLSRWMYALGKVADWHRLFAMIGMFCFICNIAALLYVEDISHPLILLFIISVGSLLAGIIYLISKYAGLPLLTDRLNFAIVWAHLLDASSTMAGVDMLGYYEKHVVPAYLIELTGTAMVMYPLKLAIFIPVLYILDSQFNDDEEAVSLRTFVKMVIIILGLSPACRNTIRMTFGI